MPTLKDSLGARRDRTASGESAKGKLQAKKGKGKKTLTFAESTVDEANKAVQATRHVRFADTKTATATATAAAATAHQRRQQQEHGGIVTATSVRKGGKRAREEESNEDEEEEDFDEEAEVTSLVDDHSDSDSDSSADGAAGEEEDLSDIADGEEGDAEEEDSSGAAAENPFVKAKRTGGKLSYKVLRLRFLPQEFQEPQLFKFLGQFGADVLNCFCVRSRRTHQSKGIAYVQFDREEVLPLVQEECNGMALGGRAVRARIVTLRRAMPSKEKVAKRRRLAYAYKTKGAPLKQHSVLRKSPVAVLIKAARTEAKNNDYLASLGIEYRTNFFTEQLKQVPARLITRNTKVLVDARGSGALHENGDATTKTTNPQTAPAASSPGKAGATKASRKAESNAVTASKVAPTRTAATPPPRRQATASAPAATKDKKRVRASV